MDGFNSEIDSEFSSGLFGSSCCFLQPFPKKMSIYALK